MTFQNLRIVLFSCPYMPCAKMSLSGKFEIQSGKCQGIRFLSERGNPVNIFVRFSKIESILSKLSLYVQYISLMGSFCFIEVFLLQAFACFYMKLPFKLNSHY